MSEHPVGATWEAETKRKLGRIWLDSRTTLKNKRVHEVWRWALFWKGGGYEGGDWGANYRFCREEIPMDARFKRIK